MDRALGLRNKAERSVRLSQFVNDPADFALLEGIAAEAIRAAIEIGSAADAHRQNAVLLALARWAGE